MFHTLAKRSMGIGVALAFLLSLTLGAALLSPISAQAQDTGDDDSGSSELSADELLSSEIGRAHV